MKTVTKDVKSKSEVVGEAVFPQYDNVQEAVQQEGEETCLGYINAQVKTNELNRVRAVATGKPSKATLMQMALQEITVDRMEELAACAGDKVKINQLLEDQARVIRERLGLKDEEEGEEGDEE